MDAGRVGAFDADAAADDVDAVLVASPDRFHAEQVLAETVEHTHQCFIGFDVDAGGTFDARFYGGDSGIRQEFPGVRDCDVYDPAAVEIVTEADGTFRIVSGDLELATTNTAAKARQIWLFAQTQNQKCYIARGADGNFLFQYWTDAPIVAAAPAAMTDGSTAGPAADPAAVSAAAAALVPFVAELV